MPHDFSDDNFPLAGNMWLGNPNIVGDAMLKGRFKNKRDFLNLRDIEAASHRPVDALTAELALFFDAEAYRIFSPYFNYDNSKLRDMILAYMNGVSCK